MEITIHTGCAGDYNTIYIDWFDHNNIHHKEVLEINVLEIDKPRTLELKLNGWVIALRKEE